MGTKKTIYNNLQHLQINNDKTKIDNDMKNPWNRTYYHFGLSQCNPEHIVPPLGFIITGVYRFAQFYISGELFNIFCKKSNSRKKYNCKNNIRNIIHIVILYFSAGSSSGMA